jgi:ABC-type phosphate transport system auxiliary subunit
MHTSRSIRKPDLRDSRGLRGLRGLRDLISSNSPWLGLCADSVVSVSLLVKMVDVVDVVDVFKGRGMLGG